MDDDSNTKPASIPEPSPEPQPSFTQPSNPAPHVVDPSEPNTEF